MKIESILIILTLISVLLLSGCIGQTETETGVDKATLACVDECKSWLNADKDLSNGPCLLNPIPDVPDWVCDVAHDPRQDVDNLPENQCSEYGKTANHFVELDPNCEFIKSV